MPHTVQTKEIQTRPSCSTRPAPSTPVLPQAPPGTAAAEATGLGIRGPVGRPVGAEGGGRGQPPCDAPSRGGSALSTAAVPSQGRGHPARWGAREKCVGLTSVRGTLTRVQPHMTMRKTRTWPWPAPQPLHGTWPWPAPQPPHGTWPWPAPHTAPPWDVALSSPSTPPRDLALARGLVLEDGVCGCAGVVAVDE